MKMVWLRTALIPNLNALVAISNGTWAVKHCDNKMLKFLTMGAS